MTIEYQLMLDPGRMYTNIQRKGRAGDALYVRERFDCFIAGVNKLSH